MIISLVSLVTQAVVTIRVESSEAVAVNKDTNLTKKFCRMKKKSPINLHLFVKISTITTLYSYLNKQKYRKSSIQRKQQSSYFRGR